MQRVAHTSSHRLPRGHHVEGAAVLLRATVRPCVRVPPPAACGHRHVHWLPGHACAVHARVDSGPVRRRVVHRPIELRGAYGRLFLCAVEAEALAQVVGEVLWRVVGLHIDECRYVDGVDAAGEGRGEAVGDDLVSRARAEARAGARVGVGVRVRVRAGVRARARAKAGAGG